jgi:hypothetical protein
MTKLHRKFGLCDVSAVRMTDNGNLVVDAYRYDDDGNRTYRKLVLLADSHFWHSYPSDVCENVLRMKREAAAT